MNLYSFDDLYKGPESEFIFLRSTEYWHTVLSRAKSTREIPASSLDLTRCLDRIPQLPGKISSDSRWLEGFSTWTDSRSPCSIKQIQKRNRRLLLSKGHATICSISASPNFRVWETKPNNGIALLTLGWAYILSADLAGRQGLSVEYDPLPDASDSPDGLITLDLEYASPNEVRWWKAITSTGTGWSTTGSRPSPWATFAQDLGIEIRGETGGGQQPPDARQAAYYLSRLCVAYDLGSQCSAALAAALTIPLHAYITPLKPAKIELPKPSFTTGHNDPELFDVPTEFNLLGYYMALSLCTSVLGPSLWSVFWNPNVQCNHAGAWVLPIADTLGPVLDNNELELVAKMLSFSSMSPLWLGLTLCGRSTTIKTILPTLTELRDYPWFSPSTDAAAWTGVAQTFLDCCPDDPCVESTVSRADVWRMRHYLSHLYPDDTFSHTPLFGWPPFGRMQEEDVEFEIRSHLACLHQWNYSHWTWLQSHEVDAGFSPEGMQARRRLQREWPASDKQGNVEPKVDDSAQEMSRRATETIFWWCSNQVERGFGGTIVPRRFGRNEAPRESKSSKPKDVEFVQAWLDGLVI